VRKRISCMEGTRVVILNDLCQWTLKPGSSMAWIHGLAGSGKSAIAVKLAEKLREMNDQVILALTFHCVKGQETSDTSILVPTIGYHLAKIYPEYAKALLDVLEKDVSLHVDSVPLREQLSILCKPLYTISALKPTIIIIDGLDEWGKPRDQYTLLDHLQFHLLKIQWLRVVVTSRLNSEIRRAIVNKELVKDFDLANDYTAHKDIELFLGERFANVDDEGISTSDMVNLVSKADGLFIWANTVMEFIESGMDIATNVQIVLRSKGYESGVEHPHARLYNLYGDVLKQNFTDKQSQHQCQSIIGLIISAYEPLTVDTLAKILWPESNVADRVAKRVINALRAVLYLNNKKVYYHLSLAEFINSEQCPTEFKSQGTLEHQKLAIVCMKVLNTELKFNICNLETSSITNHEIRDLEKRIGEHISSQLQYSVEWWAHHVNNAEVTQVIDKAVREFTSSCQMIFWLECMSLMGKINGILLGAREIQEWASRNQNRDIMRRMQELKKFTNAFSIPLYESTPHLYVSGCALLPSESLLRENKVLHLKQVVKVTRSEYTVKWEKILHPLQGHTSDVTSVAYSPDGQYLVTGSWDRTVRIWNAQKSLQIEKSFRGHSAWVTSVAYSPDGQYVVSGSLDMTARIWNVQTGLQVGGPLRGHTDAITSVVYSPDGQYVVSGSSDNTVRIWQAQTSLQVGGPLKGHIDKVTSVAYSPVDQYIVSGSLDGTVRIWNVKKGLQVGKPLKGHTDAITSVAYSPDGEYVVSGSWDKTVRIWDAKTALQVREPLKGHTDEVTSVAYSCDGQYVVSSSEDMTVRIWNAQRTVQAGEPLEGHTDEVSSVAYSPDGQYVVSGSLDKTVKIWNVQMGLQVGDSLEGHTAQVTSVAYSPDGQYVVSSSWDETVRTWNVQTGLQVGEPLKGHTGSVTSLAYSSNGQHVISGSEDMTIRIWNTQTSLHDGEQLKCHTDGITSVAYSCNGQYVVSGSDDGTVRIWNTQTGLQVQGPLRGHTDRVTSVAFSPDSQYVMSGSEDKTVRIWNAQTGLQIGKPLKGHTDLVTSAAYSHDGQYIVSASWDQTVRIWNTQTGQQVKNPLIGHTGSVSSVSYSSDSQYVVSGSWDRTIRIWNAQTGQEVREPLKGHTDSVTSVAYSPDGQYVISGSDDGTLLIWNAQTGLLAAQPLEGHVDEITSVAYSPDGLYVVSGSWDKTVRIWNTQPGLHVGDAISPLKSHILTESLQYDPNLQTASPLLYITNPSLRSGYTSSPRALLSSQFIIQLPPNVPLGDITDRGWLHSEDGQLILWLPPWMRSGFKDKRQIITIPANAINCALSVDWTNFVNGTKWTQCWDSTSIAESNTLCKFSSSLTST
ncbi:hypothetical protein GYMLUDRAFT_164023, partial [Collybiopsis luxurians FD-317 M1]